MVDSNYTHLLVISDRSGSMASPASQAGSATLLNTTLRYRTVANNMVEGLNEVFKVQAEQPGLCLVDFVQFDTEIEKVYEDTEVSKAVAFCEPRGGTALLDAIGKSVTELGIKFKNMPEIRRPGTVIVVVLTDGYENSSRNWTAEKVKALVETQTGQWGWTFTFLGANIDAVKTGAQYGFQYDNTLTYNTSNVAAAAVAVSNLVTQTRGGIFTGYTDEERDAQFDNTSK